VIVELWQKALHGAAVAGELRKLLKGDDRQKMLAAYAEIRQELGRLDTAARVASVLIEEGGRAAGAAAP
jgi:lipid A disaccharide synthetase